MNNTTTTSKLTANQIKFARIYSETNDAIKAYKESYLENGKQVKYIKSAAYHKLDHPGVLSLIEEIQQGLRAQFIMLAPDALNNIVDLANNAESEKVKFEANQSILDRAGLKPPEQIEMKQIGIFGGASLDDIRDMVRAQLEEPIEAEVVEVVEESADAKS